MTSALHHDVWTDRLTHCRSFYEQHQFTCELTGRQNLPFKIAMQSEVLGSTGIDNSFPEALKEPLLRKLNLNTDGRLEHLVDLAYEVRLYHNFTT